ncbi:hypothetical protein RN001_016435 [Aquatica leii]|uniref:Integrase catalytic domain-containing protein n=1 Tax=Aquatica leii TaxID=1421715 RepID=A0AAN7S654_9COLE|nr:hypothetical protein RN001_016435 [Aquatica leii]
MWPGLKLVHEKPRHSQSQGSVERSNQDVRDMLVAWMLDNQTKQYIPEPDREAEEDVNSTALCAICEDYGIVQPCGKCRVRIHTKCGIEIEDQVICSLCSRTDAIRDQRESAKTGLEKQAAKMLALSQQNLPPIKVSQNVVVKVPDVDRGRLAPRNVLKTTIKNK